MAAAPIAKEVADEIRNKFTALATDTSKYYDADLERIKADDKLVSRFLAHQRDVSILMTSSLRFHGYMRKI